MPQVLTTSVDVQQPSSKAMAYVKNRNNVTDIHLRHQITTYERAKSVSILNIDHDKLDLRDFLRQLRVCSSNDLPEARHWLGDKTSKGRRSELRTVRVVATAPAAGRNAVEKSTRDIKTAAEADHKDDLRTSGKFRTERRDSRAIRMLGIYNRRAELVECGPVWGEPPPQQPSGASTPEGGGKSVRIANGSVEANKSVEADILVINHVEEAAAASTSSSSSRKDTEPVSPDRAKEKERARSVPGRNKDFMKDLLVKNAKKRYRKKRSVPLEDRLTSFYTKLDEWKQHVAESGLTDQEARRQYKLLTQGVKAALADSSDEDDVNALNTV